MPDEVALTINGERFRYWNTIRVTQLIDTVAVAEFDAPFEHDAPGFRRAFRPLSYAPVTVTVDGVPLFTGTMLDVAPAITDAKTIRVSCYSTAGVLNDCTPPASASPLEFNRQNLYLIAQRLAAPFGVAVKFTAAPGAPFDRVACEPDRKILDFLVELAQQRGLLVSSDVTGALTFSAPAAAGAPVAEISQGRSPFLGVTPAIYPQQYYSHVTGTQPTFLGIPGAKHTIKNPRLSGTVRPYTFDAPDVEPGGLKAAVEAKVGRMFASVLSYSLRVATWRDPADALWAPNTQLLLTAPDAMVYRPFPFLIKGASFQAAADGGRESTLELTLPEAYSGRIPARLPWD